MKQPIDISKWERKNNYNFFKDFVNPNIELTVPIKCTQAWRDSRQFSESFFIRTTYAILRAVNEIRELRYRIEKNGNEVVEYERIDLITPIAVGSNGRFINIRVQYSKDYENFYHILSKQIEELKNNPDQNAYKDCEEDDYRYVCISVLPKTRFTSMTSTQQYSWGNPIPLITVGRCDKTDMEWTIPVAISVHHGLVDGYHLQKFYERAEELLCSPSKAY